VRQRSCWGVASARCGGKAFRSAGAAGLVSKKRGRPSNRKTAAAVRTAALSIVRQNYADFGPTLAAEKLAAEHGFSFSSETVRKWMIAEGLWRDRKHRQWQVHQPRPRRDCVGERVQVDGSEHWWFEDRGPQCTLLVFVDDAERLDPFGTPAVILARLEHEYFARRPNLDDPEELVSFGTSGHRGSPFRGSFTEDHILAITQAICDYRRARSTNDPLFVGKDTHALSAPAQCTALEVLAANEVHTIIQEAHGVTPTPVISHAILVHNRSRTEHLADGIVITPSHNPPEDGGFKYNLTHARRMADRPI